MTRSVTIRIEGRPPGPNARMHWRAKAAENAAWRRTAAMVTRMALPPGWTPLERCTMAVEFIVPDRRDRDDDNLIGAQKCVLDGIVDGGAIVDDSRRVIVERTYSQRYARGQTAAVYTITEALALAAMTPTSPPDAPGAPEGGETA